MRYQTLFTVALFGTATFAAPIAQAPPPPPPLPPLPPAPPAPVPPPPPPPPPAPAPPPPPPPANASNQTIPETKDDNLIRAGLAEKRVNSALDELKVNMVRLDESVRLVIAGQPSSLEPLAVSAEGLAAAMDDAIIKVDRAGTTNLVGAIEIQKNAESMFVLLDRLADDMILQKPAIVADGAGTVLVRALQEQNVKVGELMIGVIESLPPLTRAAAKEEILKMGNPLEKVIVAYSDAEAVPLPALPPALPPAAPLPPAALPPPPLPPAGVPKPIPR